MTEPTQDRKVIPDARWLSVDSWGQIAHITFFRQHSDKWSDHYVVRMPLAGWPFISDVLRVESESGGHGTWTIDVSVGEVDQEYGSVGTKCIHRCSLNSATFNGVPQ